MHNEYDCVRRAPARRIHFLAHAASFDWCPPLYYESFALPALRFARYRHKAFREGAIGLIGRNGKDPSAAVSARAVDPTAPDPSMTTLPARLFARLVNARRRLEGNKQ